MTRGPGKTLFILGAGASAESGGPLMTDFLDIARKVRTKPELLDAESQKDFDLVFEGVSLLQSVHSKSRLDIHNLEPVFAAFDMARMFKRALGTMSPERVATLSDAMRSVIVRTLELTIRFGRAHGAIPVTVGPPHAEFAHILKFLGSSAAVITFNYDMLIDVSLVERGMLIDYGLSETPIPNAVPLLKLHGSINWGKCANCNRVCAWELAEFFNYVSSLGRTAVGSGLSETPCLEISRWLQHFKHCERPMSRQPVIVPPTWSKGEYHAQIGSVWARAAQELADAERIFVIGYSLPESDLFFRYLYALGTVSPRILKNFLLIDPDSSGDVVNRFRVALGEAALSRFLPLQATFGRSLQPIRNLVNP